MFLEWELRSYIWKLIHLEIKNKNKWLKWLIIFSKNLKLLFLFQGQLGILWWSRFHSPYLSPFKNNPPAPAGQVRVSYTVRETCICIRVLGARPVSKAISYMITTRSLDSQTSSETMDRENMAMKTRRVEAKEVRFYYCAQCILSKCYSSEHKHPKIHAGPGCFILIFLPVALPRSFILKCQTLLYYFMLKQCNLIYIW